jgi:hypothetical protein
MKALPLSFKFGIGVLTGGWQQILTSYVKFPGKSDRKLNKKVIYSPGFITVF